MIADQSARLTAERMDDPRPGDRFSEMFSFWMEVTYRDGDRLLYGTTADKTDDPTLATLDEFRSRFSYGIIPGYWIRYVDGKGDVLDEAEGRRWIDELEARELRRLADASLDAACL